MPTLTVRDVDEKTLRRLRAIARTNTRSLSAEVRHVLDRHALAARLPAFRETLPPQTDSTEEIRTDRDSSRGRYGDRAEQC